MMKKISIIRFLEKPDILFYLIDRCKGTMPSIIHFDKMRKIMVKCEKHFQILFQYYFPDFFVSIRLSVIIPSIVVCSITAETKFFQ